MGLLDRSGAFTAQASSFAPGLVSSKASVWSVRKLFYCRTCKKPDPGGSGIYLSFRIERRSRKKRKGGDGGQGESLVRADPYDISFGDIRRDLSDHDLSFAGYHIQRQGALSVPKVALDRESVHDLRSREGESLALGSISA